MSTKPSSSSRTSWAHEPELPAWLVCTINGSIADSDPRFTKYFFNEIRKYAPDGHEVLRDSEVVPPISFPFVLEGAGT